MIAALSQSTQKAMLELAYVSLALLGLFLLVWMIASILKILNLRVRNMMRKKADAYKDAEGRIDILDVLPDLSREELKRIATDEKELLKAKEEKIDINNYEGLPLRPKVYFDPEKDKGPPDEEPPKPKIERSVLSNEPAPQEEEAPAPGDEPKDDASSSKPAPGMPVALNKEKGKTSPENDDVIEETNRDES